MCGSSRSWTKAGSSMSYTRAESVSAHIRLVKKLICFVALLCGCQVANTRALFFLMTLLVPDQRETCCHTWHDTQAVTLFCNAPFLRHKAPGSLSRTANLQESLVSPGSAQRRVVP